MQEGSHDSTLEASILHIMHGIKNVLGSSVVPFFPFLGSRFLHKVTNPKRGALIMVYVGLPRVLGC